MDQDTEMDLDRESLMNQSDDEQNQNEDENENENDDREIDNDLEDEDEEEEEEDRMDLDHYRSSPSRPEATPTPSSNLSPSDYLSRVNLRKSSISTSQEYSSATSYLIEPSVGIPHASHIHAMAISGDGSVLLSGGSDGHVRKFDVYKTMNGKNLLTLSVRHGFAEGITKGGVLNSWWANEEIPAVKPEGPTASRRFVSSVHSLVCQSEALWGLSGTQSGNINLFTIRHDTGSVKHVLRKHSEAVSALCLASNDTELISGGWDREVNQWDLNTGQIVTRYPGHMGQVTSLALQPINASSEEAVSPSVGRTAVRFPKENQVGNNSRSKSRSLTPNPVSTTSGNGSSQAVGPSGKAVGIKKDQQEDSTDGANSNSKSEPHDEKRSSGNNETENRGDSNSSMTSALGPNASKEELELEAELNASLGMVPDADSGNNEPLEKETSRPKNATGSKESSNPSGRRQSASGTSGKGLKTEDSDDDDDDSLFGGGDDDEADADADADAEGEEDVDAEGDDDDVPLSQLTNPNDDKANKDDLSLPGFNSGPNGRIPDGKRKENGKSSKGKDQFSSTQSVSNLKSQPTISSFDSDLKEFSNDVLLTSTLSGQVILYDRRVRPTLTGTGDGSSNSDPTAKGVRSLPIPSKTPPWCQKACWSPNGDKIFVGRRNESVDEWDLRMIPDDNDSTRSARSNPKMLRSLKLPSGSGPVSSVIAMPNNRHVVCASYDNVRLWDLQSSSSVPFRIVAGHHGATISQMILDPTSRFLFSSSGDRGWLSHSSEAVLIHEVYANR